MPGPTDPVRREQLRALAAGGMTVLTNEGSTLPLDPAAPTAARPLVLVGRHALGTVAQGGGSAQVRPPHVVSIAEGLVAALGADRVRVVDGVEVRQSPDVADPRFVRDPETGMPGIRITSRRADGEELASTASDLAMIALGMTTSAHEGAAGVELAAELDLAAPTEVEVGVRGAGRWTVEIDGVEHQVELVLSAGDLGAAILSPPVWTTIVTAGQGSRLTARLDTSQGALGLLGVVARPAPRPSVEVIAAAVEAASGAGTAVVVVGLTTEQETESVDKHTLALPGDQDELVRAVAAVADRTVVVVNAATPVLMPWLDDVHAVVWVGLPGQEGGNAVADVLLGLREAAGRLVTTFPAADGDGPAWSPVPTDGSLVYEESVRVGYRGWDGGEKEPRFWFGHGLGWTTWAYHSVRVENENVLVELENTGTRPGREVVQVYVRPEGESVRLAGWAIADDVPPGERRTVTVRMDSRVLRVWEGVTGGRSAVVSCWSRVGSGTYGLRADALG
ncbi:glycoside hydrolase family 3 C-terminal domain-containing protein [Fodinicola feengrottensis]|uniref:glycoside hydrolase family 3 C-terminal domain-containing protein n=1 Tax=Fodinicola feengrottensis TaxID=435914 RepID=UPI002442DB2F|nr:glycoside hydrolase family 3 C-terminal domain-containing protein [Fodinicola feengrottensis]